MKLPMLKAKLYLTLFLLIVLGIYSCFNYRLFINAENLREQTHQKNKQLAAEEIETASKIAQQRIKSQLERITNWDDIYQQLNDPSYYFYWKENSLKQSGYWYPAFDCLELYGKDKSLLSPPPASQLAKNHALPLTIPQQSAYFTGHANQIYYLLFLPIHDRTHFEIIGYIGLRVNFSSMLLHDFQLLHVDKSTVKTVPEFEDKMLEPHQLKQLLQYDPIKNPVNDFLWELIQDFIKEVLFFGGFIALLFAVFFTRLVSSPLKLLTDYVDDLQNHTDKLQPVLRKTFKISEIENLKQSISHYHRQLVTANIEIDKQHQVAYEQARIDSLSHVFNRRAFDEYWNQLLFHYNEPPGNICFLLLDCDFFKAINEYLRP